MLRKFSTVFSLYILYLATVVVLLFLVKDQLSIYSMILFVVASVILSFPLFLMVTRRVYLCKATSNTPISEDALLQKIAKMTFNGACLNITNDLDHIVLSPPNTDPAFIDALRSRNISHTYVMKLWLDEKKHLVRFKEKVVRTAEVFNTRNSAFKYRKKSGLISFDITTFNEQGELVKFSNADLHQSLLEVVTENGWDLGLKVI